MISRRLTMPWRQAVILCLILSFFVGQALADDDDDKTIFSKFIKYTHAVYTSNARQQLSGNEFLYSFGETKMGARLLGYSLGNLLQYARRNTDNHKIWLMLEAKAREAIFRDIESEGRLRAWDSTFIEDRKQKAWRECMAAQQGWFDEMMAVMTSVRPENAPNFFESLDTNGNQADTGETTAEEVAVVNGNNAEANDQNSQEVETETPTVGDKILGRWTYTNEYLYLGKTIKQKLVVVVQRAGTLERETFGGILRDHLYEGYIEEAVGFENQGFHAGQLCWKIKYTESHQPPSEEYLGYTMNSLLDQYGDFGIRLKRREQVLEVGQVKYYR